MHSTGCLCLSKSPRTYDQSLVRAANRRTPFQEPDLHEMKVNGMHLPSFLVQGATEKIKVSADICLLCSASELAPGNRG